MIISVASGKGGTGKTLVATNLASIVDDSIYVDCDVEEPNGHLFLKPAIDKKEPVAIPVPIVDKTKCAHCGKCAEVCQFNAIISGKDKTIIFEKLCHGCGSCVYFCPQEALLKKPRIIGFTNTGSFGNNIFISGNLNIGEPMAPPIIKQCLKNIKKIDPENQKIVIIDSPPGTSCPMIESVRQTDFVVLVTEPTPFGLHDLQLAIEVIEQIKKPCGVIINKSGFYNKSILKYCNQKNIPILAEIPHDMEIGKIYAKGELIVNNLKYQDLIKNIYEAIIYQYNKKEI